MKIKQFCFFLMIITLVSCQKVDIINVSGELKIWHKVTLEIKGPRVSEESYPNPFLDLRLEAEFSHGETVYKVPGYFAADGNAGESGAMNGNSWKVHFNPDKTGTWKYKITFLEGKNIAIADNTENAKEVSTHGVVGEFSIEESDKTGNDFRSKGRLSPSDGHYLQHEGSKEYFLKAGADSPENFLGYRDFDGTYYGGHNQQRSGEDSPNAGLHAFKPHEKDWKEGDPSWQNGKGKGIIGALNYLAEKGINSVYFLTLNILGDGEDVWPYTEREERYRFDCSKLDQWEIVFSHMDKLGIMMHIVLQETENENLLDGGYLDVQRKLYLRELIARFSHHNAITWNLGEEHGPVEWMPYFQSIQDTKRMADYISKINPYPAFVVMHTHPNSKNRKEYLTEYLGHKSIQGPSIQAGNPKDSHASTLLWTQLSAEAGQPWVVCIDEIGQHWKGALPDAVDPDHDTIRENVLWANLMAGGGGVEWYFGYKYEHADLNCEDWRSRDLLWDQTFYAVDFFRRNLPFHEMKNKNELVNKAYCFAKEGEIYAIYSKEFDELKIDLKAYPGEFKIQWFNPRTGGKIQSGMKTTFSSGKDVSPGLPPINDGKDWLCLLKKK